MAQALAAPLMLEGLEIDLIRRASFDVASGRYIRAHTILERTERSVRHVRHLTGDSFAQRRLVTLAHDMVELSFKEVDAVLDGDVERAARLRGRCWRARDELHDLLGRLALELAELVG